MVVPGCPAWWWQAAGRLREVPAAAEVAPAEVAAAEVAAAEVPAPEVAAAVPTAEVPAAEASVTGVTVAIDGGGRQDVSEQEPGEQAGAEAVTAPVRGGEAGIDVADRGALNLHLAHLGLD